MKRSSRTKLGWVLVLGLCGGGLALLGQTPPGAAQNPDLKGALLAIAEARGLSTDDMVSAVATYPNGDEEYLCLNSGGQASSIVAYTVPSMRILKYIPISAPDSATGFHYDEESRAIAAQGSIQGQEITWGDTHHPAFSETDGRYDGQFAFINDKANPRIFVVDLRDLETKQIVANPIWRSNHGGAFVTPNTEYVIEAAQYPSTVDHKYVPLEQGYFNKYMRGGITFNRFDREAGRLDPERSFTVLAPPYMQDLSDAGKGESYGYSFTNSLCSERYIGGIEKGRPPFEAGCSARDMDYMHVVNWKKAEEVVAAGKATKIRGHDVIPIELAVKERLLVLIPEPKSPHGVDVSPDGRYIVVSGKLDTHASVYDMVKIKQLIAAEDFAEFDPYGLPILDYRKALHGQVQLGLGPLHTQFDQRDGVAYTSLFIDSQVVQWNYKELRVLDKQSVHYNIGHLVAMQGDSQDPRGKYLIALNKLTIDRFAGVGPLHPQNHQLISLEGETMRLIYDLPLPMGEPHYTVCIDTATLSLEDVYAPGTDPSTMARSAHATDAGQERIERGDAGVEVYGTLTREGITPAQVDVKQGETVHFRLTNLETDPNGTIEFSVAGLDAMSVFPPGKSGTVAVQVTQPGLFAIRVEAVDNPFPPRGFGLLSARPDAAFDRQRLKQVAAAEAERKRLRAWDFTVATEDLAPGEAEFSKYGCMACHQRGRELGGPNLENVTVRRDPEWLKQWIHDPESFYDDPYVEALIRRYGVKMPKQGVSLEEAARIVEYLDTWRSSEAAPVAATAAEGEHPGRAVYGRVCFACHDIGVAGAPKLGDKALWAPRKAKGKEALHHSVWHGYQGKAGYMPPRGGCADCTDEELELALAYILSQAE